MDGDPVPAREALNTAARVSGARPQAVPGLARDEPSPIEDYAIVGDCRTAALISREGSLDWLCVPRFDSNACFTRLLGTSDHGRWLIAPAEPRREERRYKPDTLVLETLHHAAGGQARVTEFMPIDTPTSAIVRIVEGVDGAVAMRMHVTLRFDYGASVPWVTRLDEDRGVRAIAGPDMMVLRADVPLRGEGMATVADFTVRPGERIVFTLVHTASHLPLPDPFDAIKALSATEEYWSGWIGRCRYSGEYSEAVRRSLLTLKALTFAPTGGIVAAATTSLPEKLGGERNWDYRFCWLRDATLTLMAMLHAGYREEAEAWRDWLARSVAGNPEQIQIMYGLGGERRLSEWEASWLPGYQGAKPVRIGNAAAGQVQLDVYGELIDSLYQARKAGISASDHGVAMLRGVMEHLATIWEQPDEGIWEVRGGKRHFTFSKVMAWVAFDRAVRAAEEYGLDLPVDEWRETRDRIHAQVCEQGFSPGRNSFTQAFGGDALDASLLMIPTVGFLPPEDARVRGTIAAIERELMQDGLVLRYRTETGTDGLPAGEGVFLACSFWMVDALVLQGREADARAFFERLLGLRNDVGLLAEEYDPERKRQVGNFPQAFSHIGLIAAAMSLTDGGPARSRADGKDN